MSSPRSLRTSGSISYLTQRQAAEIDETLMGPFGFSVDQLMELAGLSVATTIAEPSEYNRVLAVCRPGNNGGDGLVAARHLHHFGYKPFVCYPKRTQKPLYTGLDTQLELLVVPFLSMEDLPSNLSKDFDILVDAMFGLSFHGTPRPPFDDLIQKLVCLHSYDQTYEKHPVIVSIDIPSGWHVEEGDIGGECIKPDMLVSLTAPKLCAKKFSGPHHFLGGRLVPPVIADKYKLRLPPYSGTSMCVRIGKPAQVDISALGEDHISSEFLGEPVESDPTRQFQNWFDEAIAACLREPNAMALTTVGKDGKPSSRMVLLKGLDKEGTPIMKAERHVNYLKIPVHLFFFYWDGLNRQVGVEGSMEKVSDKESEQYFQSRPRGSQIGAIVSKQSSVIPGRHVLYQQHKELEEKFSDVYFHKFDSKPKYWGGYQLKPELFEFWQGQKPCLHDRLQYSPQEINGKRVWKINRLSPSLVFSASAL